MARRPVDLKDAKIPNALLAAMHRLREKYGLVLMGPTEVGIEASKDYGKTIPSTLASLYLRRLAAAGKVKREPQGPRRGRYQLLEGFTDAE